jgi:hypothetical protein
LRDTGKKKCFLQNVADNFLAVFLERTPVIVWGISADFPTLLFFDTEVAALQLPDCLSLNVGNTKRGGV